MTAADGSMSRKSRLLPWLALALILAILASAVFFAMQHLRRVIVDQIVRRDGDVLYAASKVQIDPELASDPELRPMAIESEALEAATLRTNVIAMRLYDSAGQPQMVFPQNVRPGLLTPAEFTNAAQLQLASEFRPEADLAAIFESFTEAKLTPLLRVVVPLQSDNTFVGVAEFLMDGRGVQSALRALDRDLWRYGTIIFALGGGIIAISLVTAFHRLEKTNRLLEHRTRSLLRANDELTLAAKTSALGAITAHLIHDLKSPLFGLKSFVTAKQTDASSEEGDDWRVAVQTTERMQRMINDVVRILQEEKSETDYHLTLDELFGLVRAKVEAQALETGLTLRIENSADAVLGNRAANILAMILTNLAQNAIQATPRGGEIRLSACRAEPGVLIHLSDNGPGLPESIRATLFTPSRSTKTGGTGLGLAISKQLANHLGAELTLKITSEQGTIFELRLPEKVLADAAEFV